MSKFLLCAGASALLALGPGSAAAKPDGTAILSTAKVRYGDLDLRTAEGAKAMLARLDKAAGEACGGDPGVAINMDAVMLSKQRAYRTCKAAAVDAVTLQLGAPLVRSAWLSRGGRIGFAAGQR